MEYRRGDANAAHDPKGPLDVDFADGGARLLRIHSRYAKALTATLVVACGVHPEYWQRLKLIS